VVKAVAVAEAKAGEAKAVAEAKAAAAKAAEAKAAAAKAAVAVEAKAAAAKAAAAVEAKAAAAKAAAAKAAAAKAAAVAKVVVVAAAKAAAARVVAVVVAKAAVAKAAARAAAAVAKVVAAAAKAAAVARATAAAKAEAAKAAAVAKATAAARAAVVKVAAAKAAAATSPPRRAPHHPLLRTHRLHSPSHPRRLPLPHLGRLLQPRLCQGRAQRPPHPRNVKALEVLPLRHLWAGPSQVAVAAPQRAGRERRRAERIVPRTQRGQRTRRGTLGESSLAATVVIRVSPPRPAPPGSRITPRGSRRPATPFLPLARGG
jgi:hypothetical protein